MRICANFNLLGVIFYHFFVHILLSGVKRLTAQTRSLEQSYKKKQFDVSKSHYLCGQILRPANFSCSKVIFSRVMRHWHHLVNTTYFQIVFFPYLPKKKGGYHKLIMPRINSESLAAIVSPLDQSLSVFRL